MKSKREAYVGEYITDALVYLMKKRDFRDITVTEICAKAGVTRMSFYRSFQDKEDALAKRVRAITDGFLAESAISYKNDSATVYFTKLFSHMLNHRELCMTLYGAGLIHIVKNEFDRVFLSVYQGDYDDYKSYFLAGGIYNVFLLWLINGCKETPEALAARMNDILIK